MCEEPNRMQKRYKGYMIEAQPVLLAASAVWGVRFTIRGADTEKTFTCPETYANRELAVYRCFELAERMVGTPGAIPF